MAEDLKSILESLLEAAWERASAYAQLEAAFKEMCQIKYERVYADVLPVLTSTFAKIAARVRAMGSQLEALGRKDLTNAVDTIQSWESMKLRSTLQLHALRRDNSFKALPFQRASPADWSIPDGADQEENNHEHGSESGYSSLHLHGECGCAARRSESISGFIGSQEEWQETCAKVTRDIEEATNSINDQLSEITCELEALKCA